MRPTNLAWALLAVAAPAAAQDEAGRALLYGAPWQAEIYSNSADFTPEEMAAKESWERLHRCGGSLVATGWVLTAAHCVTQEKIEQGWRVRLGARDLAAGDGVTYRIERAVWHADYDEPTHRDDIALLHIVADDQTDPDAGGRIETIRLNGANGDDGPVDPGIEVSATGWGRTAPGAGGRLSVTLLQIDLTVRDCASAYRGETTDAMLCAAAPGKDTCQGDSGGPLILTYGEPVLVGIVSWGKGCADESKPGVYVRIDRDHYLDWVGRAMAADPSVRRVD